MTNEQDAVERLRDILDLAVQVDCENMSAECVTDLLCLARAWAADNPAADGETVTGDWLVSIGGKPWAFFLARFAHDSEYGSVSFCSDGRALFNDGDDDAVLPGLYDTRGKVRRLLRALGIPTIPET